jgi:hypothetical protein
LRLRRLLKRRFQLVWALESARQWLPVR